MNNAHTNPLGQITDNVMEQLQTVGSSTASKVVSEPAKILEQILGGSVSDQPVTETGNTAVETAQGGSGQASPAQDAALMQRKQQESQQTAAALYALHQQRLQEEKQYYEQSKQKQEQQKFEENRQEEKKAEIVQLKKEQQDEAVWQQQIKAVQGSHEGQQGKM